MAPRFPTVTQKELRETRGEKSCSICCVDYAHGHVPVRTPCNHVFGQNCLAAWLANNDTCPMCRTNIVPDGISEGPSRHQSSRRDEPPARSRAGTEASRAAERSSRPQVPRIESLRHEPSARPRAGTEASRIAGAPPRLSVLSSQWDETHLPTGSGRRSSHASRTAREAPTGSSHRSSHTSHTAREAPRSSSHRSDHTSRTAREAPISSSHRSTHTSHPAREEPPTRSPHRSTHTSHPAREAPISSSHRSTHTSHPAREEPPTRSPHRSTHPSRPARAAPSSHSTPRSRHASHAASNPLAQLAIRIRNSRMNSGDEHPGILTRCPDRYPAFTRTRLLEILSPGYIEESLQDELAYIADQLEESDARDARGQDPFAPPQEYSSRSSTHGNEIWIGRGDPGIPGRELSPGHPDSARRSGQSASGRSVARRDAIRNMSDDELEAAIRRLRL